jgi:excinuclease Cho
MPLPRRRRTDFEALPFEDPAHLRPFLDELPQAPGVYVFHGEEGDLPLYIGKSINLRQRVLSHLRTADEARMLRQSRRISHIRTAGEIGALLLEAAMIKQQHPLFNQKLRRTKQLYSLRLQDGVPQIVHATDLNFARTPDLYGLYASRHAAIEGLRALAEAQRLCWGMLGLEKRKAGSPCFRAMLKQCAGACCGGESLQAHQQRLLAALQDLRVVCWPYAGAVGLVERDGDLVQIHVVNHWCYLGSAATREQALALAAPEPGFDADGYKILCKPLLTSAVEVIDLHT